MRSNLVEWKNAEEGSSIYGGHGAALYNYGPFGTTEFYSKAYFRDNVGGFVSVFLFLPTALGCCVGLVALHGWI